MKRVPTLDGKGQLFVFDSLAELLGYGDSKNYWTFMAEEVSGKSLRTYPKFKEAVNSPWAFGLDRTEEFIQDLKDTILPDIKEKRRRIRFSEDSGDEVDIDRLRNGQPYWRESKREDTSGPSTVTIVTDITANDLVSNTNVLWRGAAAVALAYLLEEKGYQVELWLVEGSGVTQYLSKDTTTCCCLKRPGDTLDIGALVNSLSGWFYRCGFFAVLRTIGDRFNMEPLSWYCKVFIPSIPHLNTLTPDTNRIYIRNVFSREAALDLVRKELEKLTTKEKDQEEG